MRARIQTSRHIRTVLVLKSFSHISDLFKVSHIDLRLIIFIGTQTLYFSYLKQFGMHYKLNSILRRGYIYKPYANEKQVRNSPKGIEVYNYFLSEMERINSLISTQDEGNKIDLI